MMSRGDYLRRQANNLLLRAERADKLGELRSAPADTVLRWDERGMTYVALLVVRSERELGAVRTNQVRRWYLTGASNDRQRYISDDTLESRLLERADEDTIYISTAWMSLSAYTAAWAKVTAEDDK